MNTQARLRYRNALLTSTSLIRRNVIRTVHIATEITSGSMELLGFTPPNYHGREKLQGTCNFPTIVLKQLIANKHKAPFTNRSESGSVNHSEYMCTYHCYKIRFFTCRQ